MSKRASRGFHIPDDFSGTAVFPVIASEVKGIEHRQSDNDTLRHKPADLKKLVTGFARIAKSFGPMPRKPDPVQPVESAPPPIDFSSISEEDQPVKAAVNRKRNKLERDAVKTVLAAMTPAKKRKTAAAVRAEHKQVAPPPPVYTPDSVIRWISDWKRTGAFPVGISALLPPWSVVAPMSAADIAQLPEFAAIASFARFSERQK